MANINTLIIIVVIFLINPLITIVALAIYLIVQGGNVITRNNRSLIILFGIMCSVFISLINMEKVPEVDLGNYVAAYQNASRMDFLPFLVFGHDNGTYSFYKEPLYWAVTWLLNRLYGGNVDLFQFSISMIINIPLTYSVYLFGKAINLKIRYIVLGMVFISFFPYIFSASMNLVRQSISNSILVLIAVRHFLYGKRQWILIVLMPLFHLSSLLFLPILLLPQFDKRFKENKIWFLGTLGLLIELRMFAGILTNIGIFSDDSSTGYALNRVQNEVGQYDGLSTFNFAEVILMLCYSAYLFFYGKFSNVKLSGFLFLLIFIASFIVSILDNHMMSGRYIHYLFTFMPFLLALFAQRAKIHKSILAATSLGVIIAFTIYLHVGLWNFNVTFGGWLTPVFGYMF